jgi:hypothetical protein
MKLLAGGCSLIHGDELPDTETQQYSKLTYPALLADHLNLDYVCTAIPGAGNDTICRRVIEGITDDVVLVIVNWSFCNRFEFHYNDIGWQSLRYVSDWHKDRINSLSKPFYAELTHKYSRYKYVQDIILLQTFLKDKQIPFIFSSTDSDFLNSTTEMNTDSYYQQLYSLIDFSKWFFWLDQNNRTIGFNKWAAVNNYPMGEKNNHPLETAHFKTYELFKPTVEKII